MATKLKLRATARFLSSIFNGVGTTVRKDTLATYVDLDYTQFGPPLGSIDPANDILLVYNTITGVFNAASLASFIAVSSVVRVITAAGDVNVGISDGLIIMNKTVGEATNVFLPPSNLKVGRVKIVDWKGDSATNPITVKSNGSEIFNDSQTSWPIQGAGASASFDPVPGIGYAV